MTRTKSFLRMAPLLILLLFASTSYADINSDLIQAAGINDAAKVKQLLKQGADVNAKDKYGDTALMEAASSGHTDIVKILIDAGADVNAKDKYGDTALMEAARSGHTDIVKALIDRGADVNAKGMLGQTALMYAAMRRRTEVVKALIDRGADVNAKDEYGSTTLVKAVISGHPDIVKILIDGGADVNAKDEYGNIALRMAVRYGHPDTAKVLIDRGADVNAKDKYGKTALMMAVSYDRTDTAKTLIDGGADVNAKDGFGETALMKAAGSGRTDIAKALIDRGADVNAKNEYGKTALMKAASSGRTDTVKALIDAGADVNAKDEYGNTALMMAPASIAKALIDAGADVNAKDGFGNTALMKAASSGRTDTVKALIDAGADVNAKDESGDTALMEAASSIIAKDPSGDTALMEAAIRGRTDTAKTLIDAGADVNAKDRSGDTALMKAASSGRTDIAKALIDGGADVNAKDKYGKTALMSAEAHGHTDTAKVLIDAGGQASDSYNALLIKAALVGDTAKVKQLVKQGADVNAENSSGETVLMFAASSGHAGTVKALIDAGADVNAKNKGGSPALMYAASRGRTEVVKALIDAGADVNAKDDFYGYTVLMQAASSGRTEVVKALIDAGADVNAKDKFDLTALMRAEAYGYTDTAKVLIDTGGQASDSYKLIKAALVGDTAKVKQLLKQGADVNAKDKYGNTALMIAASSGHTETVKALIDAGADVNAKRGYGNTALMQAAIPGHTDTVKVLIDGGADVNAKDDFYGYTVLMQAASSGRTDTAKALIDAGADVNAKDGNGNTALWQAAISGRTDTAKALIDAGADVNAKGTLLDTALMIAASSGYTDTAKALIDGGADMNAKDALGETALMKAAISDHTDTVKALIDAGADVSAKGLLCDSALMEAASSGHTDTMKVLIDGGADVNAKKDWPYDTALMKAASSGHTETAKVLIGAGADVNAKDRHGETALMKAAISGRTETAKVLIDAGADVNAKDWSDNTALVLAMESEHKDIVRLLKQTKAGTPAEAPLYSLPDSAKRRLREFNTLKYAILDPESGSIILLGTYDPRYPTGPIPYYDLLKDAMHSPYPGFSLEATEKTKQAEDTIGRALHDDIVRMRGDDTYCKAWTKRLMALLMDDSKLHVDHRRFVQKWSEVFQITPEDFVRLYAYAQHPVEPIPQDVIQINTQVLRRLGLDDVADAIVLCNTGNPQDMIAAVKRMGIAPEIDALYYKKEAGEISNARFAQEIDIHFVSALLRRYNVPETEIQAKGEQVRRGRMSVQALYDYSEHQRLAFITNAVGRKLFHGLSLSQALLQRLYNVPTPQLKLTFINLPPESMLGDVLFRADYVLKSITTTPEVKEKVPGHLSDDEFVFQQFSAQGIYPSSGSDTIRFWLTPGEVKMSVATDGSVISFGQAKVHINTELHDVTGMNPQVEAVYRDAVNRYALFLTERYNQYARIFPELHKLREVAKLLALARWAASNNYRVVVDQAEGTTFVPPKTTSGFWSAIFLADQKKLGVVLSSSGGVDFGQSQGEAWVSATPDAEVKNNVLDQLAASATLAGQAADAALAGDLEGAHILAEQSAQAMTGEINFAELPVLSEVPMPSEPAAQAACCVRVLVATDDNITALQTAQADQQRAAALEQQFPAEAAQLHDSAADRQRTAQKHLQTLCYLLLGSLWSGDKKVEDEIEESEFFYYLQTGKTREKIASLPSGEPPYYYILSNELTRIQNGASVTSVIPTNILGKPKKIIEDKLKEIPGLEGVIDAYIRVKEAKSILRPLVIAILKRFMETTSQVAESLGRPGGDSSILVDKIFSGLEKREEQVNKNIWKFVREKGL